MKTMILSAALWAALTSVAWAQVDWVPAPRGGLPMGVVEAGRERNGEAVYVCRSRLRDGVHLGKLVGRVCYIGWGGREMAERRYEVLTFRGSGGSQWVSASRGIPRHAVRGGHEPAGELYVCRAHYRDGLHLGKALGPTCYIAWGDREVPVKKFEVLVGHGLTWVQGQGGPPPPGTVVGGGVRGGRLYVCRGRHHKGLVLGKFWQGRCHVGWHGKAVALKHYDFLVEPRGGRGLRWVEPRGHHQPRNCVGGGHTQAGSQCVCRARHAGGMHAGKTHQGRCHIGWRGKELSLDHYQVLVQD